MVSIHAPAWGATSLYRDFCDFIKGFNPRARVGRDSIKRSCNKQFFRFNPRARVGRFRLLSILDSFNPRARVGRDVISARAMPA
ncbi:conserved hypothetical protein [uncultured spirochete]|uniref:Uncharacterized protein n=1 Tax=uncultured spirochete TaxID=156406 RepID=A0A3P3XS50_9SPIR|nr:conserved hypothetical protein [uncultured spirochete]